MLGRGRTWVASTKLIINSYKILIRPIIQYAPLITTIVYQTNLEKIERVQRTAVRIATYLPPGISTSEMYKRVKLEPLIDRACENKTDNQLKDLYTSNDYILA